MSTLHNSNLDIPKLRKWLSVISNRSFCSILDINFLTLFVVLLWLFHITCTCTTKSSDDYFGPFIPIYLFIYLHSFFLSYFYFSNLNSVGHFVSV